MIPPFEASPFSSQVLVGLEARAPSANSSAFPPCIASGDRVFSPPMASTLPTADLLALDIDGIKSRLSKLRRYL
jgi:hypothetical protein